MTHFLMKFNPIHKVLPVAKLPVSLNLPKYYTTNSSIIAALSCIGYLVPEVGGGA